MNNFNPMIHNSILRYLKEYHCGDFEFHTSADIFQLRVPLEVFVPETAVFITCMASGFSLQGLIPFLLPDDKLYDIYKFVNTVNSDEVSQGSFVFHPGSNELRYHYYCSCDCRCNLPEALIAKSIDHVCTVIEQYMLRICNLLYFDSTPQEANEICAKPMFDDFSADFTPNEPYDLSHAPGSVGPEYLDDLPDVGDFSFDNLFEKFCIDRNDYEL